MIGETCEEIRDLLPAVVRGTLEGDRVASVQDHLRQCEDCRQEVEVIRMVRESLDMKVPSGLEARIQARVRQEMGGSPIDSHDLEMVERRQKRGIRPPGGLGGRRVWRWTPTWALSAAAILILALGIRMMGSEGTDGGAKLDPVVVAAQEPIPEAWLWDDGLVAGAPVFDDLSEEDLEELLKEYEG